MILPSGATVAVIEGRSVRLFHNAVLEPGIRLVEITPYSLAAPHTVIGLAHVMPDSGRQVEEDFFETAASFLNKLGSGNAIQNLVLIANPRTLSGMRKHMDSSLRAKIIGEVPKDLVEYPDKDIAVLISET
jgi:protein required for attachment to host cells